MIPMLMGAAAASGKPLVDATVSISPPGSNVSLPNTNGYSQNFTAGVSNGTGTFTYLWSWASGGTGLTIGSTTSATCNVHGGPFTNQEKFGTLKVVVTDTGNGNKTCTDSASIDVVWGSPI